MRIELITTGTELLIDRVNTHIVYLGRELGELGVRFSRQTSVGDGEEIEPVLREALVRSDVIIVTGGLGPTSDDLTRDIAARLLKRTLRHQPEIEAHIRDFFIKIGRVPPASVFRQALVPEGAEVLPNAYGTAPGLFLQTESAQVFFLPGPPRELKPMWTESVLPRIRRQLTEDSLPVSCKLMVGGIGESALEERIGDRLLKRVPGIEMAYCASPGKVELRLTHHDAKQLERGREWVKLELKRAVQTENGLSLEQCVVESARRKGVRLATAESCTGGLVAHRLTNVSGASAVLDRGWVTYSNESKISSLGVPCGIIEAEGAVSAKVAVAMARGALQKSQADLAVSLTGIAGPTGGSPEKPVGLVFLGWAYRPGGGQGGVVARSVKKHLVPEREIFKNMAADVALDLFRRRLLHWNNVKF